LFRRDQTSTMMLRLFRFMLPLRFMSVVVDKGEKLIPLKSESDHVQEQPAGVLLDAVKPAREDLPGDSHRHPPPKAWDPTGPKAKEAAGPKPSISSEVRNLADFGLHQDVEKGKVHLGCRCKQDLNRVHKGWAERWLKIRGKRWAFSSLILFL
jgi:hypothetical protein